VRQIFTLLIPLVFFSSCTPYYSGKYLTASENSLSTIPLRPHANEVDVFLDNEKPSKPYYKVKLVETQVAASLSADEMLIRLKQKAKEEGLDAIIVNDIGRQTNTTIPSTDGLITYQKLVGLGLKYKERIDYMETILKEQLVSLWPDDNPTPKIFSMNYDFNVKNISLKDTFIRNFFYNEIYVYENEKSLYGPAEEWEFRMDTFQLQFSKRRLLNGGNYQKADYSLNYADVQKATITAMEPDNITMRKYELSLMYNANGMLIEKRLKKKKGAADLWLDKIEYRFNGMPDKISRYKIVNGKEVLYFEIQNKYYSVNDLPRTDN